MASTCAQGEQVVDHRHASSLAPNGPRNARPANCGNRSLTLDLVAMPTAEQAKQERRAKL